MPAFRLKIVPLPAPLSTMITYPARPTNGGSPHLRRKLIGEWATQPKFNGWRALVLLPAPSTAPPSAPAIVWNRRGDLLSITKDFLAPLTEASLRFPPGTWLDCEFLERRGPIKGTIVVFDLVIPALTYTQRREILTSHAVPILPWDTAPSSNSLVISDEIPDIDAACNAYVSVNERFGEVIFEGVVRKRIDSTYPIQLQSADKRTPYWVKHRFA